jgi:phosphate transport system permease protein
MSILDTAFSSSQTRSYSERTPNAIARKRVDRMMHGVLITALMLALFPLVLILFEVIRRGAGAMTLEFLTSIQLISLSREGGGYLNGLVGTLYMVAIAVAIAVPLGIATATFVVEYSDSKLSPLIQFFTDVMTGVPSIFVGLFVYSALVQNGAGFSTLAGGLSLSLLMIPIVARASEEIIRFGSQALAGCYAGCFTCLGQWTRHCCDARRGARGGRDGPFTPDRFRSIQDRTRVAW